MGIQVSDAAVEAAAKAIWDESYGVRKNARPTWESITNDPGWYRAVGANRRDAMNALEAAAPHMEAAALNEAADALKAAGEWSAAPNPEFEKIQRWLRTRAAAIGRTTP